MPFTLLISTGALIASSVTLHTSLKRVRRGDQAGCARMAIATYCLGVVARRAGEQKYTQASHNGIVVCGIYWHSLDVIWIVLYATLWLGSR